MNINSCIKESEGIKLAILSVSLIILNEIISFLSKIIKKQILQIIIFRKSRNFNILPGDTLNVAHFVAELDTIIFIRMFQKLRSESGGDKLGVFR